MCSREKENIIVKPDNNKVSLHHTALSSLVSLLEYTYPVPEEKNVNIIDADLIPHTETTTTSPPLLIQHLLPLQTRRERSSRQRRKHSIKESEKE